MQAESSKLREIAEQTRAKLLAISQEKASAKPYGDKWSLKEILGHLTDSASNNLQRIVRMQEKPEIGTFRYSQQHWVASQGYQDEPWTQLVDVWYFANRHLAHVIGRIDPKTLDNTCDVGDTKPANLKLVVEDYLRHVQHHLDQIFTDADPRNRKKWKDPR